MTFFVDTNVLAYAASDLVYRAPCRDLLARITTGRAAGRTSVTALEELWHLELSRRVPGLEHHTEDVYGVMSPLLPVDDETFAAALRLDVPPSLGANDRLHVATCLVYDIATIVSADRGFDGLDAIRRVDPLDAAAMARLLG